MKNVLVDMHRLKKNPFNGLYTFSFNLAKSLAPLSSRDLRLHFYLPKEKFGLFGDEVTYKAHHSVDKYYLPGTSQYDVWHATTTISWYKPFNKRTRFIFTLHDLNFLIEEAESIKRNSRLLKMIQKRIDRADYLTFISAYAMEIASQHLQLGNKPRAVVYNGSSVNDFSGFDSPGYRPLRPFLFTIGLVQQRKNFHLLPALLKGNDYELVISGLNHFDYKHLIDAEIAKFDVADRVTFTGAISEEEKYWYYKNCTAFMFPSYAEGFGLPVIEAMHFGKPVFLSDKTCLPEIGGELAYYFRDFDTGSMRQVFNDGMNDFLRNDPAEKIKQRAAIFDWDKAAGQYVEIYKELS